MEAAELFEKAIDWLRLNYGQYQFFAERDVVWTLQTYLIRQIREQSLPYQVFHGYTIPFDDQGKKNVDLVLINKNGVVEVAAEFKYEPSHQRQDLMRSKFPVVFWSEAIKDVASIRKIAEQRKANVAYSILVDEGGHFLHQPLPSGTVWKHWHADDKVLYRVSLLWLCVSAR